MPYVIRWFLDKKHLKLVPFESGLHYIGDWHTHPQDYPVPSQADKKKILKIFNISKHELSCMLLLIIGGLDVKETFWLGRVTKQEVSK